MNGQTLLKGAGCGVLLTLWYVKGLLGPSRLSVYFHPFPLATVFLGVLADLIVISLLASLAWAWTEHLNMTSLVWPVLLAGVLLLECHSIVQFYTHFSHQVWAAVGVFFVIAAFALRWWSRTWFGRATQAVGWSVALCGFPIFLVVPELSCLAASTSGHEVRGFSHAETVQGATVPRICWILFDELSYDQVYEHRADGLALPNFDRLHRESVTFTNVQPAAQYTNLAIPAMFLGRPVSRMRSSASGDLNIDVADRQRWERFDVSKTVFADARRLRWTSGIVGWANPYCRFMAGWVDDCYWIPEDDPIIAQTNLDPSRGVVANATSMPLQWLHTLLPIGASNGEEYNRNWVAGREHHYDLAMERARALIQKSSIRFLFIHLPVPHPPAIYDRKTRRLSDHGSYLDNLALADVALYDYLRVLDYTPEVPSDHPGVVLLQDITQRGLQRSGTVRRKTSR